MFMSHYATEVCKCPELALDRIQAGGGSTDQYRTFYSCLYRSLLFPRKFYEFDAAGKPVHYSPYNGQVCD